MKQKDDINAEMKYVLNEAQEKVNQMAQLIKDAKKSGTGLTDDVLKNVEDVKQESVKLFDKWWELYHEKYD